MRFLKNFLSKLGSLLDYVKEHSFRFSFMLIIFILLCSAFYFLPKSNVIENDVLQEQNILLGKITIENWVSYVSVILLMLTSILAIYQFDKNNTLKQQECASKIAESFSNKLTFKCFIICEVIKNSKLHDFLELKTKGYDSFKVFNTDEIRHVYNDDDFIEKYKNICKESNFDTIYYRLLESYISNRSFEELMKENKHYTTREARKLFILDNLQLPFKFNTLICDTLNELEYLCMGLSSQAAGSKYVYQSLHQVFLRTIRFLAVTISTSNNTSYTDKFYTNLIYVYNEWTRLYTLSSNKEEKLRNKVNNLLEPKIKTV